MTPAETLARLLAIVTDAQSRWTEFVHPIDAPDGLPTSSSSSDRPKVAGGSTSDPTPSAAFRLPYIPEREARDKLIDIASSVVTLWSLTPHAVERLLPDEETMYPWTPARLMEFTRLGIVSLSRYWHDIEPQRVPYCNGQLAITLRWAGELEGLMGPRSAPIEKSTWKAEEMCTNPPYDGGRRNGERPHDHTVKPVPAVTLDGKYCAACYERVRRAEVKDEHAA